MMLYSKGCVILSSHLVKNKKVTADYNGGYKIGLVLIFGPFMIYFMPLKNISQIEIYKK